MSRTAICDEFRERLSAQADGELRAAERASLASHLDSCPECRSWRDELLAIVGELDRTLPALVAGENPARPFPERRAPGGWAALWRLAPRAALVASSFAIGFLTLGYPPAERMAGPGEGGRRHAGPCPWHRTEFMDLARTVSYPVLADPCLGHGFELVEARVQRGASCRESVRLTYRDAGRTLFLEQEPASPGPLCPLERLVAEDVSGCLESGAEGGTRLRWAQGDRGFLLHGDVAPGEALAVARTITQNLALE